MAHRRVGRVARVHLRMGCSIPKPASLQMPTEFVGQNGATIHETIPVSVTGCPKVKAAKKASKKKAKGKKGNREAGRGGKRK